jgi:hypothetical protein
MNECITIDDIYENSNISDIDIHIENMISLKLINRDYASAMNIIGCAMSKLMDKAMYITNLQIEECKENTQDNIIRMTRYIDVSRNTHEEMGKKIQEINSGISYIENIRSSYIDVYTQPIYSININYDYNTSTYRLSSGDTVYNIVPCKFISKRHTKTNDELIITQRYCAFLINKLFNGEINNSINELLQLGSCIIFKALESKKN